MSIDNKPHSFKLIVLGDSGVGKTSLSNRQSSGLFTFQMTPTVGTTHMKTIVEVDNQKVELKIWDTAGQEKFASLVSMYARGANVCLLVASFIDPQSIKNLDTWLFRLHEAGEHPPIIVAINKTDILEGAPTTIEDIREEISTKYPNLFFVSAKTGDGVSELFACAAQEALSASKDVEPTSKQRDLIIKDTQKTSSNCC